jgi:hypothetical protein
MNDKAGRSMRPSGERNTVRGNIVPGTRTRQMQQGRSQYPSQPVYDHLVRTPKELLEAEFDRRTRH